MPTYKPDLSKVQLGFVQLPKDDYEFAVGEPKTFSRDRTEKDQSITKVFGIQYPIVVKEAASDENKQFIGRTLMQSLYFHTEKTESVNFAFAMACYGFGANEVDAFREKFADADFSVDTDTGDVGSFWKGIAGTRVSATADLKPRADDPSKNNQQFAWRPI